LLASWSKAEAADLAYKKVQTINQHEIETTQKVLDEKRQQIQEKKQQLEKYSQERNEKLKGIPEQWREIYERMHNRITNPVVPIIGNSCSACFFQVSAQDMNRLRNRALLQCKQCYRFLYSPEAMRQV
jgi:predicted  nucleic acid-binding Zn-ribbon protein